MKEIERRGGGLKRETETDRMRNTERGG